MRIRGESAQVTSDLAEEDLSGQSVVVASHLAMVWARDRTPLAAPKRFGRAESNASNRTSYSIRLPTAHLGLSADAPSRCGVR